MNEIIVIYGDAPNPHLHQSGWETEKMSRKGSKYPELNDRKWLYQKYWIEEQPLLTIKDAIGCAYGTLIWAFKKFNIDTRGNYGIREKKYPILADYEWIYHKYWVEDLSPGAIATIIGCNSETVRQAIKDLGISSRNLSECRQGKRNHQWRGGLSFEPYCYKFTDALKEGIRDKFGRTCFICEETEEAQMREMIRERFKPRRLCVHHVDHNKQQGCNGVPWLLVPLCQVCSTKVNYNREYWQDFIIEKMRGGGYI